MSYYKEQALAKLSQVGNIVKNLELELNRNMINDARKTVERLKTKLEEAVMWANAGIARNT